MKYRVLDFVWARPEDLAVHPEAKVPIAEEDREALEKSVKDGGVIQPLLVTPAPSLGKQKGGGLPPAKRWWIVDGANRYRALTQEEKIPCVVVETDNVRDLALECASVGRSRSAGQRIMVYLERHKEEVLAASEKGKEFSQGASLKKGQMMIKGGSAVSRETAEEIKGFSSEEIAKALGVSRQDTLLAIDLLRSHEHREGVATVVGGLREEGRKLEEGDPELKAIDEAWAGVLAGRTPIRRWKAAVGGKRTTKEVQRAEIRWVLVGRDGLTKVRNALGGHWENLSLDERLELLEMAREVAAELPREVREVLAGGAARK